jgi:hypothetical protein
MEQDMDEEVEVDTGGLGGLDFAKLRTDPAAVLGDVYKQQMAAQRAEEIAAKDRYEAARARIEARNQGPSTSEQLFAISQALLAPRKYRGIAGTIGKLSGAFGDISEAQRKATMSREDQLAQLQEAYMGETAKFGTRRAQTAADLVELGKGFAKPARTGFNPVTGQLLDMDTGAPVGPTGQAPSASKVGTLETRGGVEGYFNEKNVWVPLPARPEKTTWRPATPEEAGMYGAPSGQISSTGEFKPGPTPKPREYKPVEVKMLTESEELISGADETLRGLNRALELNSVAFEGSLTGIRKKVGSVFASDDPAYVAAEELDNVLANIALGKLKTTFPGSITEGERKILMDLQGSSNQPRAVRERIIRNAIPVIQRIVARNKQRIEKIQSGEYSRPGATGAKPKTRVVNW